MCLEHLHIDMIDAQDTTWIQEASKNRLATQNTVEYWFYTLATAWQTGRCESLPLPSCPASRERIVLHIACPAKNQNSKFEVRFLLNAYRYHTIVTSKNRKSDHRKSGTVCTCFLLEVSTYHMYLTNRN